MLQILVQELRIISLCERLTPKRGHVYTTSHSKSDTNIFPVRFLTPVEPVGNECAHSLVTRFHRTDGS